jgi:uncharacterized protein YbjT (DUF2867 family)
MKIVVIGGTGLIGSKVVSRLQKFGHNVMPASPNTGVNVLTGEGLADALAGAKVVVDVANSPSFDDDVAMNFFETAGRNLLAAETVAGVGHHLALSVVGTERLQSMGYFRAKLAQEALIKASGRPWTLLRATQFFPFVGSIVEAGADGDRVHVSSALFQPVAPDDVANALADLAVGPPQRRMIEVAGPEASGMDRFAQRFLDSKGDSRRIVATPETPYFGIVLDDASLTPGPSPRLGTETFKEWLAASRAA